MWHTNELDKVIPNHRDEFYDTNYGSELVEKSHNFSSGTNSGGGFVPTLFNIALDNITYKKTNQNYVKNDLQRVNLVCEEDHISICHKNRMEDTRGVKISFKRKAKKLTLKI